MAREEEADVHRTPHCQDGIFGPRRYGIAGPEMPSDGEQQHQGSCDHMHTRLHPKNSHDELKPSCLVEEVRSKRSRFPAGNTFVAEKPHTKKKKRTQQPP